MQVSNQPIGVSQLLHTAMMWQLQRIHQCKNPCPNVSSKSCSLKKKSVSLHGRPIHTRHEWVIRGQLLPFFPVKIISKIRPKYCQFVARVWISLRPCVPKMFFKTCSYPHNWREGDLSRLSPQPSGSYILLIFLFVYIFFNQNPGSALSWSSWAHCNFNSLFQSGARVVKLIPEEMLSKRGENEFCEGCWMKCGQQRWTRGGEAAGGSVVTTSDPNFFQNHAAFRQFWGKTPILSKFWLRAPSGVKTPLAPWAKSWIRPWCLRSCRAHVSWFAVVFVMSGLMQNFETWSAGASHLIQKNNTKIFSFQIQ